jgi:hypothetical protein
VERIATRFVISNIGPTATVMLNGAEAFGAKDVAEAKALLWHVGDAVRNFGEGGAGACAETGRSAAERTLAWLAEAGPKASA